MKYLFLVTVLITLAPCAHAAQATAPTCTLAAGTYTGGQQIGACTDANAGTKIQCGTFDGTTPVTNGLGTGCTNGFALVSPSYPFVGATETAKLVAGTSTLTDSTVLSLAYTINTAAILPSAFGFQCGLNITNCPISGGTSITWPVSQAYPDELRLWDSGVSAVLGTTWATIESSAPGVYTWTVIDAWLDRIYAQTLTNPWLATQAGPTVMLTFGFTPCKQIALCANGTNPCGVKGCIIPTDDLPLPGGVAWNGTGALPAGSASFNAWVTALLGHCHVDVNSHNNCVSTLIKNYELWNEPNLTSFWTGTEAQIYQMVAPAVAIIRANVTGATVYTASSASNASYASAWMALENNYGRISDKYAFHSYLNSSTPEARYTGLIASMLAVRTANAGWTNTPPQMTETGGISSVPPFGCDTTTFTVADCIGQVMRWYIIQMSNGVEGIDYYSWTVNIGSKSDYARAYASMMYYLVGGHFTGAASLSSGTTWTVPFVGKDGVTRQFVWTTSEAAGQTYTVPSGYYSYRDINGGRTITAATTSIPISTQPIMLEQATTPIAPAKSTFSYYLAPVLIPTLRNRQ